MSKEEQNLENNDVNEIKRDLSVLAEYMIKQLKVISKQYDTIHNELCSIKSEISESSARKSSI